MEHASLGITVGDENLVISLGDTVWLRNPVHNNNNNNEDDDNHDNHDPAAAFEAGASEIYQEDNVDYYGSSATTNNHNTATTKNASIARIERMWEEPDSRISNSNNSNNEQDGRFKIRARWFLKVSNIHIIYVYNVYAQSVYLKD